MRTQKMNLPERTVEQCTKCEEYIPAHNVVWVELIEGTNEYYAKGIPRGKKSQGWFPFGNYCAKQMRCD